MDPLLEELIFKFSQLKQYLDSEINKNENKSYLQNYLSFQYFPFFDYTESIINLYEKGNYNAATVLLRTLVEAHMYVNYFQINDWKHKLSVLAKDGFDIKLKTTRALKEMINKYPNLVSDNPDSLLNEDRLNELITLNEERKKDVIQTNSLDQDEKTPDLFAVAQACDKADIKGSVPGQFQQMYNLEYRYISPLAHLNLEGLHSLIDRNEQGEFVLTKFKNHKVLISESIGICIALTKDLFENKVIESEIPKLTFEIEELCNKYLET
ncbi:MAG: hypothetical protein JWN89_457 [Parcubacteria group bacterium]|nr:hypothetical protein [Parcubacteria group bacterium]